MEFSLSGEIFAGTGIDRYNLQLIELIMGYFQPKNYSPELNRVVLFFICRPFGPFTQRRRYDPARKVLMVDIMLDFDFVIRATNAEKKKHYFDSFNQLYPILQRYKKKIKDFKAEDLQKDLNVFLAEFQPMN